MRASILVVALAVASLQAGNAAACQSDDDCALGSSCQILAGTQTGVCVGGTQPGDEHDKNPFQPPTKEWENVGKSCRHDYECGMGGAWCQFAPGASTGVCVR